MNDFNRGQLHQRLQSEQKGPSWSEVNDLCAENEQLRKENTRRYHLMSEMWAEDLQLKAEIERASKRIDELENALRWARSALSTSPEKGQLALAREFIDKTLANYEQEKTVIRNTLREERDQLLRKNSQLISVLRWARSTLRQRQGASKVLLERIDDALKKTGEQQ